MTNLINRIKEAKSVTKAGDLITTDNAKTLKGLKEGYSTGICYMAPADNYWLMAEQMLGIKFPQRVNLCGNCEIAGCKNPCLFTAGRGKFASVMIGRMRRTDMYVRYAEEFKARLVIEIARFIKRCEKHGVTPVIRLNGTSDIRWERLKVTIDESVVAYIKRYYKMDVVAGEYENIMSIFPNIQFYDYTKLADRLTKKMPANYDLTFSYSGVATYQKQVAMALTTNARIAVVFRDANSVPAEFMGRKVVDGDNTDLRFLDEEKTIVALIAKGGAKKDKSGFVVDIA